MTIFVGNEKNGRQMIALGQFNRLRIVKEVEFGLYLDGGDDGEILLPRRYVPGVYAIGDELDVFLYLDSEERLVATTLTPKVRVGEFALLRVNWVNEFGAFLDWGLMKDLFVPFREQKKRMEVGRSYMVHAHLDEESFRITASAKVEKYLFHGMPPYGEGEAVRILVWQMTDLGYKVIVENRYQGLLYHNEVFQELLPGNRLKAFVRRVRPDGKLDLVLQKAGRTAVTDFSSQLLERLRQSQGFLPFTDRSDAQEIYAQFRVSKKTFKKAVGDLYKNRLITLEDNGLRLVQLLMPTD